MVLSTDKNEIQWIFSPLFLKMTDIKTVVCIIMGRHIHGEEVSTIDYLMS